MRVPSFSCMCMFDISCISGRIEYFWYLLTMLTRPRCGEFSSLFFVPHHAAFVNPKEIVAVRLNVLSTFEYSKCLLMAGDVQ